jgi:hypothetical protein
MDPGDSRGRPGDGQRRPGLHDRRRNRAAYMALYQAVLKLLELGATAGQARRAFELAAATRQPWDLAGFDDFAWENIHSIRSRALDDAIEGRPPCPIRGHDESEQEGG